MYSCHSQYLMNLAQKTSSPYFPSSFCQLEAHVDSFDSLQSAMQSTAKFSVVVDIVNSVAPPLAATKGTVASSSTESNTAKSGKKRERDEEDAESRSACLLFSSKLYCVLFAVNNHQPPFATLFVSQQCP